MSRIGKKPISVPDKVTISNNNNVLTVKGPLGQLVQEIPSVITVKIENNVVELFRDNDLREVRALHGLSRALLQNMVTGVTEGFKKTLDIIGVGYKVEQKGTNLLMSLGFSHPVFFMPPDGVTVQATTPTQIVISGYDKQLVGLVASKIRSFKKPEPYKGKGIKYSTEVVRRKAGKTAGK